MPILSLDLSGLGSISAVIDAPNLHNQLVDVIDLLPPHPLRHPLLLLEQVDVGLHVSIAEPDMEHEELLVVYPELKMMERVARGTIEDGVVSQTLTIVDEDGPGVNVHEERDVGDLLEREHKGKYVVGDGLGEPVDGVESVAQGVGMIHL